MQFLVVGGGAGGGMASEAAAALAVRGGVRVGGCGGDAWLSLLAFRP